MDSTPRTQNNDTTLYPGVYSGGIKITDNRNYTFQPGIFGEWHLGDEPTYPPGKRGFDETFIHGAGGIGQTYPGSCGDAPGNRYSLVCDTSDGSKKWQLFDLNADDGEKENIAAENPAVVARLEAVYDQWWNAILPCLENEKAVGPVVNPFKKLYWEQFGGGPTAGARAKTAKE